MYFCNTKVVIIFFIRILTLVSLWSNGDYLTIIRNMEKIDNKTKVIIARIKEDEFNQINKICKEFKLNKSEYLRQILLKNFSGNIYNLNEEKRKTEHLELIKSLSKIGVNINQIAKQINIIKNNYNFNMPIKLQDQIKNTDRLLEHWGIAIKNYKDGN